tara:strand:+ start:1124 stop:3010 length:1887 start_codon:yes stop_codon:yes gene_type:complete
MSTYKNIIGKPVKTLSSNLDNDQAEGQIWYNSTDQEFKNVMVGSAWASSANMVTESRLMAGFGTQTAAVSAGGNSNTANLATTQHYNGTGWNLGGNLPEARFNAGGLGVETAGMSVGGGDPPGARSVKTFEYNGSSWTAGGDLTEEREGPFSFGTETAGICAGGESLFPGGVTQVNTVDEYNGSSWTAVNAMSTTRYLGAACGTETAGVVFGGEQAGGAGFTTNAELYDGTNWTSGGSVPSAQKAYQAASGQQTDAFLINGYGTAYTTAVSEYNGSTFTTGQSTAVPRSQLGASKQQANTTNSLAYGGINPGFSGGPRISATEEFQTSINVITAGAWASSGALSEGRATGGDCGISTAGLIFGGNPGDAPYSSVKTEEYGGTSWTTGGDIPQATSDLSGAGTQTAALAFGWSSSPTNITASYDGSSWTAVPATIPSAPVSQGRGIGTQTAALMCGYDSTPGKTTDEYDGSSWTSGGVTNTKRDGQKPAGWGTQTAALLVSGYQSPPATITSNVESYNGSAWTETGHTVVTAKKRTSGTTAAPNSNGFFSGGSDNAGANDKTTSVQLYNGTTWVTQPNLSIAKLNLFGFGTSTSAVVTGGDIATAYGATTTEEFTGETTAVNVKTITTS